jgi:hypothetical protein
MGTSFNIRIYKELKTLNTKKEKIIQSINVQMQEVKVFI